MADTLNLRSDALTANMVNDFIDRDENDAVLAAGGDMEAFVRLYHAHLSPLYRYLYTRLGDRSETEDAAQQVFERAWSSLQGVQACGGRIVQKLALHYRPPLRG